MATYNGERFIVEQLESIARQTQLPFELVIADDGSTDGTMALVHEFAATAPFNVKVIEGATPLDYRMNFRRAVRNCSGAIIALCDQDDVWQPDKLEKMTRAFDDPAVLLAYHNATVWSHVGTRALHVAEEEEAALRQQPLAPFKSPNGLLMLFRSELSRFDDLWDLTIDQNEGDVLFAHDQWYFFLARTLGQVKFVDEPLLLYRQHGANTLGVSATIGIRERIFRRLVHFGTSDEWAARSALSRAKVLRMIRERESIPRLGEIADRYELMAARRRRRAAIYCSKTPIARGTALLRCLAARDYRRDTWAFQPLSLLRDAWSGVIRAKCIDPARAGKFCTEERQRIDIHSE